MKDTNRMAHLPNSSSLGMQRGIPMVSLPDLHQIPAATAGGLQPRFNNHHFAAAATNDDHFFDQMISSLPPARWPDFAPPEAANNNHITPYVVDESSLLASRLRQHHLTPPAALQLNQQQMLIPGGGGGGESGALLPLPVSFGSGPLVDPSGDHEGAESLYNGFGGSLQRGSAGSEQHFSSPQSYDGGGEAAEAAPARQRVRARRGQATDPHSIAERQRRERIAGRMKSLQELVPNANKADKASNLDEIIDYVKFLQLQVKVLSMSRLGGAATVAPLVANISSEVARGRGGNAVTEAGSDVSLAVMENQVAKLMEEDTGSALQYLQGKGLCLMPISLASAISTVTRVGDEGPSSSNISALTVQSAMANAGGTTSSVSKI